MEKLGIFSDIVLRNPQSDGKFPCAVIQNPLKVIDEMDEYKRPIKTRFSVLIEYWANKKYDCMDLSDQAEISLRDLNLILTNVTVDGYDEITRKYRYGGNYEVIHNGIDNSLDRIK